MIEKKQAAVKRRTPKDWALLRRLDDWQRRLPLTYEGKIWLVFALALFVTGLWRSINLITLLASFLLMALLVNWRLARRQLRGLRGKRIHKSAFFAGQLGPIVLEVYNPDRRAVGGFLLDQQERAWWVPGLEGKQTIYCQGSVLFSRRGRQRLGPMHSRTGFPLGLADCQRALVPAEEIVVLPRLGTLRRSALKRLLQQHSPTLGLARTVPRRHPSAQTDFHGLRAFQPGDSTRWIHWRTTARRGELMVREFEESPSDNLILLVDPYRAAGADEDARLELVIRLAATICWEWCRQKGDRLVLGIAGTEPVVCQGVTGSDLALTMLEHLALEPGSKTANVDLLLERLNIAQLPTAPVLLLSTHVCEFLGDIQQVFHRPVAVVNVALQEHGELFEEKE